MTPQELKNSILQLAIQGKLVEQRPEEGTAEELYRQIQREKQALIKAGKLKKEKPLPEIKEDEKPFEIPERWMWVRLDDLVTKEIKRGKSPTYTPKSGTLVFAQKCNTKAGYIDLSLSLFLDETKLNKYPLSEFMLDMDIVVNSTGNGTLGRVGIYRESDNPAGLPIVPDSHVTVIRTNKSISVKYIFYWLKYYQPYMEKLGSGSTNQTELSASTIKALLFPLPPLAEQQRIVAKIEELLPLIDRYEQAWTRLEALNKRFPEDMQKSLLQFAIQGKLVEQRPEEGTAAELYRQIQREKQGLVKAGKIKKEKPLPDITEDEKPFEIPEGWMWVRIGKVFNLQAGKNITRAHIYKEASPEHQYPCYGGNGCRGYVASHNRTGHYALIGRQGALCGNINYAKGNFYATEHAVVVEQYADTDIKWCGYFLKALNLNQYATATAQPGLAVANINQVLIPLPPLGEQKRIVARLEELLPLCKALP